MLWTRVQGKYGEGRCRQGGGVRTGNEGWLARGPRESGSVGTGRLIRNQPVRLWGGQKICFLTSPQPSCLEQHGHLHPHACAGNQLPKSAGTRSSSLHMTKKGHLLSRKVSLQFLFPPPEVSGSQESSHTWPHTGQIEQGANLPRCSDVKMSSGPNHHQHHLCQLSS